MCNNYWYFDACRQCHLVCNLVPPGKIDAVTGSPNTAGYMCQEAQVQAIAKGYNDSSERHNEKFLAEEENFARCRARKSCEAYNPNIDAYGGDLHKLMRLTRYCSPECEEEYKAYVPSWGDESPLREVHYPRTAASAASAVVSVNIMGRMAVQKHQKQPKLKKLRKPVPWKDRVEEEETIEFPVRKLKDSLLKYALTNNLSRAHKREYAKDETSGKRNRPSSYVKEGKEPPTKKRRTSPPG
ncbi:hypothetical protein AB5N19_02477 [Seiridium cardinale]